MRISEPSRAAKALGLLWLLTSVVLVASALALLRVDALNLPAHDPSSLEFWFASLNLALCLPFLLAGTAIFRSRRPGKLLVVALSLLLIPVLYSLWTTRNWFAA